MSATCPLPPASQNRNLFVFAACTGLQYLAAPVMYVGITQASLCERLGADARVSNLPATFYFAMTAMPALIVWLFPHVRHLKWTLCLCYAIVAAAMLSVAFVLRTSLPDSVKVSFVILQGAISGAAGPTAIALLWEVVGRGTDESRRGLALGLAFGIGPILAVVGSLGQVYMLGGEIFGWKYEGLGYPNGFVWLFRLAAPAMLLGSVLGSLCIVPQPDSEPPRKPVSDVMSLIVGLALGFAALGLFFADAPVQKPAPAANAAAGTPTTAAADDAQAPAVKRPLFGKSELGFMLLVAASLAVVYHFRDILTQRTLLIATIVTILVYSGNTIPSNMNLYSKFALGDAPEKFAGLQNTLRFGFKVVAGLLLGWLLTKTNPRAGIFATSGIYVVAMLWAIIATGKAYLVAFGIFGAGELIGVYCPNYMVSATPKANIRRAMAFVTMLMVPAAPTGYVFGAIVDALKPIKGEQFAFRTSFAVCALMIVSGIILAFVMLPAKPTPAAEPEE